MSRLGLASRPRRGALQNAVRRPGPLLVLLAALAAHPTPAAGQWSDILSLQSGDSVRLRVRGALRVSASMSSLRQDTLILNMQGIDGPWPVSGFDLVSLERYTDRTPRQGLRNGATVGLVVGIFAGAIVGITAERLGGGGDEEPSVEMMRSAMRGAGLGAAIGAVGGGIVGGRQPGRGWVRLALPVR